MSRFIILGGFEPYIIEAEDWEAAFWQAWDRLRECIASITKIPEEDGEA